MNEYKAKPNDELLTYQTRRLQDLIEEVLQCCETRTSYLSRKFDLPQAELRCLMLFGGERYLTSKGIAQKLDVAKSRVTKIINGLIQKKLVDSVDDPKDARIKLISLTGAGHKKHEELTALIMELHQMILLELGTDERKMVLSSLDLLRSSMEAVKQQLV